MKNPRKYGTPPYKYVVVHGGPGAGGEMAPVARRLASRQGILEPIQTASSIEGQVEELRIVLAEHGDPPVILASFSWGAWLCFIFAAVHPSMVKGLVLIGSGPFDEKYVPAIQRTRLSRLKEVEKREVEFLTGVLENPEAEERNRALARFGSILSKADSYDPISVESGVSKETHESSMSDELGESCETEAIGFRADIFQNVWKEAAELRKSGKLLELGKSIRCPVVAIHGDYDPHPAEGVRKPLSGILKDFKFILLPNCGHMPWIERDARDKFFKILMDPALEAD